MKGVRFTGTQEPHAEGWCGLHIIQGFTVTVYSESMETIKIMYQNLPWVWNNGLSRSAILPHPSSFLLLAALGQSRLQFKGQAGMPAGAVTSCSLLLQVIPKASPCPPVAAAAAGGCEEFTEYLGVPERGLVGALLQSGAALNIRQLTCNRAQTRLWPEALQQLMISRI